MQGGRYNGGMDPPEDEYLFDEPAGSLDGGENNSKSGGDSMKAEEAVMDLAELEQLQEEAERMKGLGNKHMAAQVRIIFILCCMYCFLILVM